MTAEQKAERNKTWRGPIVTALTTIALALFWWAISYKAVRVQTAEDIKAVTKTATETSMDFKAHCIKQNETDATLARELGAINAKLDNIDKSLK